MKTFITNQKALADKVGCSEKHLSNVKRRKARLSQELAETLEGATQIESFAWMTASKPSINKRLREFFEAQKYQMISCKKRSSSQQPTR